MQSLLCERMNPKLQRQLKEPMVFLQVPLPQASLSHSLISTKEKKTSSKNFNQWWGKESLQWSHRQENNPWPAERIEGKKTVVPPPKKILHRFIYLILTYTKIIKGPTTIYPTVAPSHPSQRKSKLSLVISILKSPHLARTTGSTLTAMNGLNKESPCLWGWFCFWKGRFSGKKSSLHLLC